MVTVNKDNFILIKNYTKIDQWNENTLDSNQGLFVNNIFSHSTQSLWSNLYE